MVKVDDHFLCKLVHWFTLKASKMKLFAQIVNGYRPLTIQKQSSRGFYIKKVFLKISQISKNTSGRLFLTIFAKGSILDVWEGPGPEYAASGK